MLKSFLYATFLLFSVSLLAQQTGKVDYPYLGVSFEIPEKWIGQEAEAMYTMASHSIPGIILIMPHDKEYSLDELEALAKAGLNDGYSTSLSLSGQLESFGKNAIGGTFEGYMEGQPAKAFIIGVQNPYGPGATIIAATTSEQYNQSYKNYALSVKNSLNFSKPDTEALEKEWKSYLSNSRLTYMDSYYDNSVGLDGVSGGGYSSEEKIDLCSAGYFNYRSNNSVSYGSDNASVYSQNNDKGSGTWKLEFGAGGKAILVLNYYSGETFRGELVYENKKLYMNGRRYFCTRTGDYAPNCY